VDVGRYDTLCPRPMHCFAFKALSVINPICLAGCKIGTLQAYENNYSGKILNNIELVAIAKVLIKEMHSSIPELVSHTHELSCRWFFWRWEAMAPATWAGRFEQTDLEAAMAR